jgi:GxxExxY protein
VNAEAQGNAEARGGQEEQRGEYAMTENEISGIVVDAAIEVHRQLGGPGLLEDMYEEALCHELSLRGLSVHRQTGFRVQYKGKELDKRLRIDVIVEGLVIIEVKAVDEFHPIFESQLLTYLRQTDKRLGLVINFGERLVKDGIHRVVNRLDESKN